jgi:hypothetical protein
MFKTLKVMKNYPDRGDWGEIKICNGMCWVKSWDQKKKAGEMQIFSGV